MPRAAAILLLLGAAPALAQSGPGEARTALPTAPDLVRLKNGGLLRGTISELVPGDTVTIVTAAGDVRRIAMSEVEYAGPASAAQPAPLARPELSRAEPPRKKIELAGTKPDITFHRRTSSAVTTGAAVSVSSHGSLGVTPFASTGATYAPLCLAPCKLSIEPGTYYLALSLEDGPPVSDNRPIVVREDTRRIVGDYESYAELRTAGYLIGGAGLLGAIGTTVAVLANDLPTCNSGTCDISVKPLAIGVGISLGTMILGYILGAQSDEVRVAAE